MMSGRIVIAALAAGAAVAACAPQDLAVSRGAALFEDYCTVCHGSGGRGDGTLAADWDTPPADLTTISQRNGGTFPLARVLSQIDGYSRKTEAGQGMPELGAVFQDGPFVTVDTGDGIATPVPEALLDLAAYVESLQQ
jgi:mono/diheme cytochrome c family protein